MITTSYFKFDWILVGEIAVGPAPRKAKHLDLLASAGIKCILSLCSEEEVSPPEITDYKITSRRVILPDHTYGRDPTIEEFESALDELKQLKKIGPVYIHCKAGVERSPLVCIAWLTIEKNLSIQQSLDYLMQVHPGTNPLASHLMILKKLVEQSIIKTQQIAFMTFFKSQIPCMAQLSRKKQIKFV